MTRETAPAAAERNRTPKTVVPNAAQGFPEELQVEDPDAAVRLEHPVGSGSDGVVEVGEIPLQLEGRRDQRQVVDPHRGGNAVEGDEAEERSQDDGARREQDDRGRPQGKGAELLREGTAPDPQEVEPGRESPRAGRAREQAQPEDEPRRNPGRVRVRQERGTDRAHDLDGGNERDRAAEEEGRGGPRSPGPDHFWKKRKRFTADGPREKKSPEMSGRAQSSSEAPPRSSGWGTGSPFR